MTSTVRIRASQITKEWHVIDAAGKPLGRVATEVATLLTGKHKPTWEPHLDDGDFVIVINAAKIHMTGRKDDQVKYYRHSGYPGGIKMRTFREQLERDPRRIMERTVWGMLPKNNLGRQIIKHLKVYSGPDHPHEAQITGSERARAAREAEAASKTGDVLPRSRRMLMRNGPAVPRLASEEEAVSAAPARAEAPVDTPPPAPAADEAIDTLPGAEAVDENVAEVAATEPETSDSEQDAASEPDTAPAGDTEEDEE